MFKFDLKKVLNDFLNDVQVVTEFEEFRKGILKKFDEVMKVIAKAEGAEIYIVGHSEGSVVAYFGLLNALSLPTPPAWVNQVRGLMTIGSPIEPHLLLWADLWNFTPSSKPPPSADRIAWWNYRDYGDPIAYNLEKTREWMDKNGWAPFFDHNEKQDVAFSRYVLPGKAHLDYWKDKELFAHFFENVVELPRRPEGQEKPPLVRILRPETPRPAPKPGNRWFRGLIASVFPYVLVGTLMFLAVYFLYTPVAAALGAEQTSRVTFGNLAGLTLLLAGMTAVVRIPRVMPLRRWLWFLAAFMFFSGQSRRIRFWCIRTRSN